jgi:hypothetical protein
MELLVTERQKSIFYIIPLGGGGQNDRQKMFYIQSKCILYKEIEMNVIIVNSLLLAAFAEVCHGVVVGQNLLSPPTQLRQDLSLLSLLLYSIH